MIGAVYGWPEERRVRFAKALQARYQRESVRGDVVEMLLWATPDVICEEVIRFLDPAAL